MDILKENEKLGSPAIFQLVCFNRPEGDFLKTASYHTERPTRMASENNYLVGQCQEMCPIEEQLMREKEGLVHSLEKGAVVVKSYVRSAAGLQMSNPALVRPPQVLHSTVHYLFNHILCDESHKFSVIYGFLDDRLKSVKQDLFLQQPPSELCFPILEPIVRFYAYSAYRLGSEVSRHFDSKLNHNQLLESLKWLLREYSAVSHVSETRLEMECLYLVLNLGDPQALMRSLVLSKQIRQPLLQHCERLSLAWFLDNYVRVLKEVLKLPLLHFAVFCVYQLPNVRRFALTVLNTAYSSKNLTVPLSVLTLQLLYNSEAEASAECKKLGIQVVDGDVKAVHFNKTTACHCDSLSHTPSFLPISATSERFKTVFLPDLLLCSRDR
ncbi:SAC3 domain-containing protein 1 isoform X3 [Rhodnius prolixus]|uniref:SAC3 domain-containing protein 1 isoform X3 n=1 Tax=Rhodnius prolixus TaxID=13249 RepID=UPI003D188E3A